MNMRTKIYVALGTAVLLAAPLAFAGHDNFRPEGRDVVTGHTVFVDAREFDPDIAAIAGIVERKVVWFNGVTIFDRTTTGFVIAVQADETTGEATCDPRQGEDWEFVDQDLAYVDPNGQAHVVTHYTFRCGETPWNPVNDLVDDTALEDGAPPLLRFREHAWVTPTHVKIDDPTVMDTYNFGLAVDTSLMVRDENRGANATGGPCTSNDPSFCHDGTGGDGVTEDIKDGDSENATTGGHTPDAANTPYNQPHRHNVADVELFFVKSDPGGGKSTGCAIVDDPATTDVDEAEKGQVCRQALGCDETDPNFDPDPTTPQQEPFSPNAPPCAPA